MFGRGPADGRSLREGLLQNLRWTVEALRPQRGFPWVDDPKKNNGNGQQIRIKSDQITNKLDMELKIQRDEI